MRKVDRQITTALTRETNHQDVRFKGLYHVTAFGDTKYFSYRGYRIATITPSTVVLDNHGYRTATTKAKMNVVLSALGMSHRVYQKDYQWYIQMPHGGSVPFPSCGYVELTRRG